MIPVHGGGGLIPLVREITIASLIFRDERFFSFKEDVEGRKLNIMSFFSNLQGVCQDILIFLFCCE